MKNVGPPDPMEKMGVIMEQIGEKLGHSAEATKETLERMMQWLDPEPKDSITYTNRAARRARAREERKRS